MHAEQLLLILFGLASLLVHHPAPDLCLHAGTAAAAVAVAAGTAAATAVRY